MNPVNTVFIHNLMETLYTALKLTLKDKEIYKANFDNQGVKEIDDLRQNIITNQIAKQINQLKGVNNG